MEKVKEQSKLEYLIDIIKEMNIKDKQYVLMTANGLLYGMTKKKCITNSMHI